MPVYNVVFERQAIKQLQKIDRKMIPAIKDAVLGLASNPRPQGYEKLKGTDAYRIRVGNYRVIYEIHDKIITVVIIDIGNRKDVYRRL
jgi:mRNA interferase RelE/StbE